MEPLAPSSEFLEGKQEVLDNSERQEPELPDEPLNYEKQSRSEEENEVGPHPEYVKKLERYCTVNVDIFHPDRSKLTEWYHELYGMQSQIEIAANAVLVLKKPLAIACFGKNDSLVASASPQKQKQILQEAVGSIFLSAGTDSEIADCPNLPDKNAQQIKLLIDTENFEELKTALEKLQLSHCIVVGVIGPARKGKSSIISRLFDKRDYFPQGHSTTAYTSGIVIGAKRLFNPDAVLIGLDNEGTNDPDKADENNELILGTINFLLSDVLIVNYQGSIDGPLLRLLRIMSRIALHLVTKDPTKHITTKELAEWSPVLIFTARDYRLEDSEEEVKEIFKAGGCIAKDNAILDESERELIKEYMQELDSKGKLYVVHMDPPPSSKNKRLCDMADAELGDFGSDVYRFQALVMKIVKNVLSSRQREDNDRLEETQEADWKKERMHVNTRTFCDLLQNLISKVQGESFKIDVLKEVSLLKEETIKVIVQKLKENLDRTQETFRKQIPIRTQTEFEELIKKTIEDFRRTIKEIGDYSTKFCDYFIEQFDEYAKLMVAIENENKEDSSKRNSALSSSCLKEFDNSMKKQKGIEQDVATKIKNIVDACKAISTKFSNEVCFDGVPSILDFQKDLNQKKNDALMNVLGRELDEQSMEKFVTFVLEFQNKRNEYYDLSLERFGSKSNGPTTETLKKSVSSYLKEIKSTKKNYYEDLNSGSPLCRKHLQPIIKEYETETRKHLKEDFEKRCQELHSGLKFSPKFNFFDFCIQATSTCKIQFEKEMMLQNEKATDAQNTRVVLMIEEEMNNFKAKSDQKREIYEEIKQKKWNLLSKLDFFWCDGSLNGNSAAKLTLTKIATTKMEPFKATALETVLEIGATAALVGGPVGTTVSCAVLGGVMGSAGGPVGAVAGATAGGVAGVAIAAGSYAVGYGVGMASSVAMNKLFPASVPQNLSTKE